MWKLNYKTNPTTAAIHNKGYTLTEFTDLQGISLRTYRRWEKRDSGKYSYLKNLIKQLESNNE